MEVFGNERDNVTKQAALVLALARAGRHGEVTSNGPKVQERVAKSAMLSLQIARAYAVCAAARGPQQAKFAELAVKAVEGAVGDEYKDAAALENDPDLESVRGEAGFKAIVDRIKGR
jgi:hypothetical protein